MSTPGHPCRRCGTESFRTRMPSYLRPLRLVFGQGLGYFRCVNCTSHFLARRG